jgi:hypothetical protein
MTESVDQPAPQQRHLVSSILSPALRLWLRSQVEQVEDLQVQIAGGDRQILTGYIPQVAISAQNAVYQGLHLSQIQLTGSNIRINLGQVLRGKSLRLLAIVPVKGEALFREADLNASLQAPLLADAVTEFLLNLLQSSDPDQLESDQGKLNLQNLQLVLDTDQFTLSASLVARSGQVNPVVIRSGLGLASGHELRLENPQWLPNAQAKRGLPLSDLDGFQIDLGADVDIAELRLEPGQLICRGQVNVIPT